MQQEKLTEQTNQQPTTLKEKFCYPLKIFVTPEIQSELKCDLNNEILHEPVIDGCGHHFCKKCITHYVENEKKSICPISKKKINLNSLKIPKKQLIDKINNLEVRCIFFRSGCQFTGLLSDIERHLEKECPIQQSRNLFAQAKEHIECRQLDKVIDVLNKAIELREISNTDLDISAASFYIRKALTQAELNEFTQAETTLLKGVQTLDLPDEQESEQEKKEKAILKIQTFKNFAIILEAKNQSNVNIYYEKAMREAETLNDYIEQYKIKILQAEYFKQQQQKQQQEKKSQQEQEEDMQLIQQFMFQQMMNMQQNPNLMESPEMDEFLMKLNKPQENKAVQQLERVIDSIDDILSGKQSIKVELTQELKEQFIGQKITAIQSLGNIYMEMMTFDKAKVYYEKSLEIVEKEQVPLKLKANVLYDLGVHYREVAMQKQNKEMLIISKEKLLQSLELLEKEPKQSQQQILRIKMELAQTHDMLQAPQEAMKLHEEVLKIQTELKGEKSEEVAHCYTLIAATHATQNNWEQALQYENKAYEICKEFLKKFENVPDRATMLKKKMIKMCNNIYTTNRDHEKMWDAIKFLGCQYKLTQDVFTEESEEMLEVMDQVAKMMSVMRRWKKAFKYHKKIIDVKIKLKGENSFEVSEAYVNFAEVYQMKKDNKSAIDLIKKAVEILEKLLKLKGTDQFNQELYNKGYFLIHWLQKLADIYEEEQDLKLMVKYLSKVVQLKNEVDNPFADLVKASFVLANYYFKERHYMRALDYLQQTLEFIRQIESENPMDQMRRMMQDQKTSQLLMNAPKASFKVDINLMYAGIYEQMQQYSKMLSHAKSALDLSKQVNGEYHKDTIDSYVSVGKAYRHLKQLNESLAILQSPLSHIIAIFGPFSNEYSEQIYQIANTYFWLGNDEDDLEYALENFQESNFIRKNKSAIDRGVNFVSLGFYYYKRKQHDQQDIFMRNALEQFETGYKMNRLGVCKTLDLIGKLFDKLNDDQQSLLFYKKSLLIKKELAKGVLKAPKHEKTKMPKKYKKTKNVVQKKFMKQQKQKMMQRGEIMEIIRELSDISIDEVREDDFLTPEEMIKFREEKQIKKLYPNETPVGKYVRQTTNKVKKFLEQTKVFIFGQDQTDLYQGLELERKHIKMIEKKKEYYKTQQNEKKERLKQKIIEDSKKSTADSYFYIGMIYEKQDALLGYQFVNKGYEIKQKYFDHDHYELIEMQKKRDELIKRLKKADIQIPTTQNEFNCDIYMLENINEKPNQPTQYEIQEQKKKQKEFHVKCMQRREAEKIQLMKEVEKIKKEEKLKKQTEKIEAKAKLKELKQKKNNQQAPEDAQQKASEEIQSTKQVETMEGQEGEHLDALFKKGFLQPQEKKQTQQGHPAQIMGEQIQHQSANMHHASMNQQQQHMQSHHMEHMDPLQFMLGGTPQMPVNNPDENAMQAEIFNFLNQFQMEQQNMIQEQQQDDHHLQQQEFNPFMNMNPQQFGEFNQFMQMASMAQGAGNGEEGGFNPFALFQQMQQNQQNVNDEQNNLNNEEIQQRQYLEEFQRNMEDPEFQKFAQNFSEQFKGEIEENINLQPKINQQQQQQMNINHQIGIEQDEENVDGVLIQQEDENDDDNELYFNNDQNDENNEEQEQEIEDNEKFQEQEDEQQQQQLQKKQQKQQQQLEQDQEHQEQDNQEQQNQVQQNQEQQNQKQENQEQENQV